MALPNPIYIDQNALHEPSSIRLLSYGLTTGVQGVLGSVDCRVQALGTPGGAVQVMPGAYNVLAKHSGGSYEAYAGKFNVAETSKPISPTTSSGGRADLVVLVIKNPYVQGAGTWPVPADPEDGPYAEIEVIEGVPSTTWDVSQVRPTWSAITLARIDRGASTGVVNPGHIRDLRSLSALGGTRTVVEQVDPPPIAQQVYAASKKCSGNDELLDTHTSWRDFPAQANWQVPVPEWARTVSVMLTATPASRSHIWAETCLNFGGTQFAPREVDYNMAVDGAVNVYRPVVPYGGVYTVPSSTRGKLTTVKLQARSARAGTGKRMMVADAPDPDGKAGCYVDMWLLFQRNPDVS